MSQFRTCVIVVGVALAFLGSRLSKDTAHQPDLAASSQVGRNPEGHWTLEKGFWCGIPLSYSKEETKTRQLVFSGQQFKHDLVGKGAWNEGTFVIDGKTSPSDLDLSYTIGDVLGVRKCLLEINDSQLRLAYSAPYLPGLPKDELENAKEMFAKRPTGFGIAPHQNEDSVVVLVFSRTKY